MTIAILATGDELIHGDTLNTNARDLAQILSSEGMSLGFHLTSSDKEGDLVEGIHFLTQEHDILIIIGGLGPTTDDRTRFALAAWTKEPLVEHQEALAHVEARLKMAKLPMNPGNLQQCLFPQSAKILPNPHGSAVGCYYQHQNKTFILLPGPPRECLPMFNDHALPLLRSLRRSNKELIQWRIFGLAESEIGETLEKALEPIECQTGYRLDVPYIDFKVRSLPHLIPSIKAIIDPIIAPHDISLNGKKASRALHDLIAQLKEPITILDDATGGLLQSLLSTPRTKNRVYFYQHKKISLHLHLAGLHEYWSEQGSGGLTQVTIHYGNQNQEGGETHQLPYRSPLVLYYAAEFLSFRLFHLISQLK